MLNGRHPRDFWVVAKEGASQVQPIG